MNKFSKKREIFIGGWINEGINKLENRESVHFGCFENKF